ncbi:MAG: hypothetical protein LBB84_10080 [Tannerellaceae bacterium]|jgi:hypothetical protein|nr:hypothetical protein [Tannerellaceae bacterium]
MAAWIIIVCLAILFLLLFRKKKPKEVITPSKTKLQFEGDVMGKTTVVLRQMQTSEDRRGQVLKPIENPDTFATDEENEPLNINVSLEYESSGNAIDEFDESEETEELHQLTGGETGFASGASFEDLEHSYDVIRERKTSENDERKAATIIRSEGDTEIFQQMVAQVPQGVERVTSIMDKYFSSPKEDVKPSNDSDWSGFDVAGIL